MKIVKIVLQCIFFGFILNSAAQNKQITGSVLDSLNIPLDNATIIATSTTNKNDFKFTTSNEKGNFLLQLEENTTYKIEVSYIGFYDFFTEINASKQITPIIIKLNPSIEQLKDIVINYKVEPVIIKKDTVVFDVSKFTNGNERKLKDQLQKLPGIEVSKNGTVYYQGKEIKTTLVESDSFFGGGSKIAIENIPADAVDKIVLLDNFSEVNFMKPVSESTEMVMNIKLKKDKKKFVFGDIFAGHATDKYYKMHADIFYYSPKHNLGFIGDLNNNGSNVLEFSDIMRIESNTFSTFSKKKNESDFNLFKFTFNNDNVVNTIGKFSALNYNFKITPKTKLEAYLLYSNNNNLKSSIAINQFSTNNVFTQETRNTNIKQELNFTLFNLKLNSKINENTNLKYSLYLKQSASNSNKNIDTETSFETNFLNNKIDDLDKTLNHFLEYNHKKSLKNYETFVLSHIYKESVLNNNWFSNAVFLENFIPLQTDLSYNLQKDFQVKSNSFNATYTYYWVPNSKSLFTVSAFGELLSSSLNEIDKQLLTNGSFVNFDPLFYGNTLSSLDRKLALQANYKFILKKWTNTFGLGIENMYRKLNNINSDNEIQITNINPVFTSTYKFSEAHVLEFNYAFTNDLIDVNKQASGIVIASFNTLLQGNVDVTFQRKHSFVLDYKRNNPFKKYYFNMLALFSYTNLPITDGVVFSGIEQLTKPSYINIPNSQLSYIANFTKNITNFDIVLNTKINYSVVGQSVNSINTTTEINRSSFGVKLKTNNVKWPLISIGYDKGYNSLKRNTSTQFESNSFLSDIEIDVVKHLILKADYNYTNNSANGDTNYFQIANVQLEFANKNKPWLFKLGVTNVFNANTISNNTVSDYISTFNTIRVLPRIAMLSLTYKL
uniref:carboxypeptidase-like regulatory domain-containing protein n=1 Tax=Flavobacterium sp. TaxID=239 RepID=UPI0040491D0F